MNYGIQMYSLRDISSVNLDEALKTAAELGYKSVEFAGFFGNSAEEVSAMLEKYGLACSGTHSNFDELINDFDGTVKYHKAIGNKLYIIPSYDLRTKEKLDTFIDKCNELGPKLHEFGIELAFHNHAGEFKPNEDGIIPYPEIEKRTNISLELDTYWLFVAGLDPVETVERLKDRVRCIHLKDGSLDGKGCSLGSGSAPVAAVREKAMELGLEIIVESEGLNPTGKEEVERCISYLKTLE